MVTHAQRQSLKDRITAERDPARQSALKELQERIQRTEAKLAAMRMEYGNLLANAAAGVELDTMNFTGSAGEIVSDGVRYVGGDEFDQRLEYELRLHEMHIDAHRHSLANIRQVIALRRISPQVRRQMQERDEAHAQRLAQDATQPQIDFTE